MYAELSSHCLLKCLFCVWTFALESDSRVMVVIVLPQPSLPLQSWSPAYWQDVQDTVHYTYTLLLWPRSLHRLGQLSSHRSSKKKPVMHEITWTTDKLWFHLFEKKIVLIIESLAFSFTEAQ